MARPARSRDFIDRAIDNERDTRATRVALAYHTHDFYSPLRQAVVDYVYSDAGGGTGMLTPTPVMTATGSNPCTLSGTTVNMPEPDDGYDIWMLHLSGVLAVTSTAYPASGYIKGIVQAAGVFGDEWVAPSVPGSAAARMAPNASMSIVLQAGGGGVGIDVQTLVVDAASGTYLADPHLAHSSTVRMTLQFIAHQL